MSMHPLTLTAPDRETLRLALASRDAALGDARTVADLVVGMSGAVVVRSEDVPPSVVTLNSRVRVRTVGTDAERVLAVVVGASDLGAGRVSVFTPVGAALLGRRAGEVAECEAPAGRVRFRIEAVVYQPEASGSDALAA